MRRGRAEGRGRGRAACKCPEVRKRLWPQRIVSDSLSLDSRRSIGGAGGDRTKEALNAKLRSWDSILENGSPQP